MCPRPSKQPRPAAHFRPAHLGRAGACRRVPRTPATPTRPRAATAWTAARAVTTRWYDHQQHLTHRRHNRLTDSARPTPLTTTGNASPPSWRATWSPIPKPSASPAHSPPPEPATPRDRQGSQPHRPPTRTAPPGQQRERSPPVFLTTHATDQHHPEPQAPRAQPPIDAPPHLREIQDQSHTTTELQAKRPNNQTEHDPRPRHHARTQPLPCSQIPAERRDTKPKPPSPLKITAPPQQQERLTRLGVQPAGPRRRGPAGKGAKRCPARHSRRSGGPCGPHAMDRTRRPPAGTARPW